MHVHLVEQLVEKEEQPKLTWTKNPRQSEKNTCIERRSCCRISNYKMCPDYKKMAFLRTVRNLHDIFGGKTHQSEIHSPGRKFRN